VHTRFWWGGVRERDHLDDLSVDERIIVKWVLNKWDGDVRTGFIWLRISTGGALI
jgi:hypothetical protein